MKFGLDAAEAWLDSLSSVWKRVLFFWGFLVVCSLIGQKAIAGRFDLQSILSLGGVTYVFLGPLFLLSLLVAPIVWIRFIHFEKGGVLGFLILGALVGLNAGFEREIFVSERTLWRLRAGVFAVGWVLLLWWARQRQRRNQVD